MDELRRKIMQLEIEEAALKKEEDRLSKERLEHLQQELAEFREQYCKNRKHSGIMKRHSVERVQKIREREIEQINNDIQKAQRSLRSGKSSRAAVWKTSDSFKNN